MALENQKSTDEQNKDGKDAQMMPKDMPMRERERIQFITFDSIKRNFHKVFGN